MIYSIKTAEVKVVKTEDVLNVWKVCLKLNRQKDGADVSVTTGTTNVPMFTSGKILMRI